VLLHGWPDDATTFDDVSPVLQRAGLRTFAPWLRGCGGTRFRSPATARSGEIAAMAQDVLDFAGELGLDRFAVVGQGWGARIAYLLAAVVPQRIARCAALSLAWEPGTPARPSFEQAKSFWYQWFMSTACGAELVRSRGKDFARFQWQSWSPPGWFDAATFDAVARSFENPDWAEVTLHAYRVRWGEAPPDPRYAELAERHVSTRTISVPTLMMQGGADRRMPSGGTEGREQYFTGSYERRVLDGVGHFPTREAPGAVSDLLLRFLHS
jgi:pimeloyl-ACP methyl ester carboxylesterase